MYTFRYKKREREDGALKAPCNSYTLTQENALWTKGPEFPQQTFFFKTCCHCGYDSFSYANGNDITSTHRRRHFLLLPAATETLVGRRGGE